MQQVSQVRSAGPASTSPRCPAAAPRASRRLSREHAAHVICQSLPNQPRALAAAVALSKPIAAASRKPELQPGKPHGSTGHGHGHQFDIVGLGQAVVDYCASVSDEVLDQFRVDKGGRRVVTVEERGVVMETLDDMGCPSQVSAGGSLANTLVAVARLARASGKNMRVSMAGSLGNDTLGEYFTSQMSTAGVQVLIDQQLGLSSTSSSDDDAAAFADAGVLGHTGTVMVLTTPDAQRSFLSFFISDELSLPDGVVAAIRSSRLVVIEGYMWEAPGAERYVQAVVREARRAGAQVALTAGDPGVVSRHREEILRVLQSGGADILFANAEEAAALLPVTEGGSPAHRAGATAGHEAALELAQVCPVVIVTDGSKGSYISAMGQLHVIPPHWTPHGPRDTCGAGDAYAAGVLYAALAGYDLRTAGEFGARVASSVISQFGAQLSDDDAERLVRHLPEHAAPLCLPGVGLGSYDALDYSFA